MTGEPLVLITVAALAGITAMLSPQVMLGITILMMGLAPEVSVGGVYLRPDDVMIALLVIAWALGQAGKRAGSPLDRPMVAYVLIGVFATLWGAVIGTADLWSTDQLTAAGFHVLKRVEFVLYFLAFTGIVKSIADAKRMFYIFMAALAGLIIFGLRRFGETGYISLAPLGAAVHEPGLASMLAVALALGLLVGAKRASTSFAAWGYMAGAIAALPFTLGRNFIATTGALLAIVAVTRKRILLFLAPLALIAAPLLPEHVLARVTTIRYAFSPVEAAFAPGWGSVYIPSRLAPGIAHSLDVLMSSPLLGWGLASVALGEIDSEYALQFVATGLVGFIIFIVFVRAIVRLVRTTMRQATASGSPALPLVAGLQYSLLGFALYSLFSPSISAARAGAFFFTILGLLTVFHRELNRERSPAAPGAMS